MIRKVLPVFLVAVGASLVGFAQVNGGSNDKLQKLWEKEKYETVAINSEIAIEKDRKDAEAYLWQSMAFLELLKSDDPKILEYYEKNAFKDALKSAGKFIKYDKDGLKDSNMDFLNDLKGQALEMAKKDMEAGDYRKATYTYKYLVEIFPDDPAIIFLKGVADAHNNNNFDAEKAINAGIAGMKDTPSNGYDVATKPSLSTGFVMFSEYLAKNQYSDSARVVLNVGKDVLPGDAAINAQLTKLAQ